MLRIKYYILLLTILIASLPLSESLARDSSLVSDYEAMFSTHKLKRHISFLASDLFEGRATGSTGANLSAKYLADRFDEIGLFPIGHNGTFYQHIPMHSSMPTKECDLKIIDTSKCENLKYERDFLLYSTGEQAFIPGEQELYFVGYGINAMEFDYSDYFYIDVEDKIVVFIPGEPYSERPDYFNGKYPSKYASIAAKQRTAMALGAKGSIIIGDEEDFLPENINRYINTFAFDNVSLAYSPATSLNMLLTPEAAEHLFTGSGFTYSDVKQMQSENKIKSFPLKTKLSFSGKFKERDFISQNIVGMLPGSDEKLRDSYIIISAHYDHLGIGPAIAGDSIYNGCLDNALGCAGLLELAAYLKHSAPALKRSVIFILTTGEEKGLLGSTYYVDNPIFPLYKTVANINIDGLAFIDEFNSVVPIGAEYSELAKYIDRVATRNKLKISSIPEEFMQFQESFQASDQAAFAMGGIPSVLIMDGMDYKHIDKDIGRALTIDYSKNKYHQPSDDLNININFSATKQHLAFLADLIMELANSKTEPEWNSGNQYLNIRLRSRAEKK